MPSTTSYPRWLIPALGLMALAMAIGAGAIWVAARTTTMKIAFVGSFSKSADSAAAMARDGAWLAVEECNEAGGIRGSQIALLVGDDAGSPNKCARLVNDYLGDDCWAIIGPTTSQNVPAVLRSAGGRAVTISPTVDDDDPEWNNELYTVGPSNSHTLEFTARYLFVQRHLHHPLVIISKSYSDSRAGLNTFQSWMSGPDSDIARIIEAGSLDGSLSQIARDAAATPADCVVILAPCPEAAILIQHLRLAGSTLPVIVPECLVTDDLILYGGRAVEGVTLFSTVDLEHPSSAYHGFAERFQRRFSYAPSLAAARGYEAAHTVLLAVAQATTPAEVRRIMASRRSFDGLQGRITFNEAGDTIRELIAVQVRDRAIHTLE